MSSTNAKKKVKRPKKTPKYRSRVLIEWIMDRSGSMQSTWSEDLNGFKAFVEKLRSDDSVDQFFSLTTFDTLIDRPLVCLPLDQVKPEILADYGPRGGTALYDALGTALLDIETRENDFDKIIVVVVTDGFNNSSRTYSKTQLNAIVDKRLQTGKYTFTYLGTQPETWAESEAKGLGMWAAGTIQMSGQAIHRAGTYTVVADSLNAFKAAPERSTRSLYASYADPVAMACFDMKIADDTDLDGTTSK